MLSENGLYFKRADDIIYVYKFSKSISCKTYKIEDYKDYTIVEHVKWALFSEALLTLDLPNFLCYHFSRSGLSRRV